MILHPFMTFAIVARVITLTLTTAILIVLMLQLRRDSVSRAFAALIGIFALNTLAAVILRFVSLAGGDISLLFKIILVAAAAMPATVFIFVVTYIDGWTPFRRRLAWLMLVYIPVVGVCTGLGWLSRGLYLDLPEGTLEFERTLLTHVLVIWARFGFGCSLWVMWRTHRKAVRPALYSGTVLAGVIVIILAGAVITFPALSPRCPPVVTSWSASRVSESRCAL